MRHAGNGIHHSQKSYEEYLQEKLVWIHLHIILRKYVKKITIGQAHNSCQFASQVLTNLKPHYCEDVVQVGKSSKPHVYSKVKIKAF